MKNKKIIGAIVAVFISVILIGVGIGFGNDNSQNVVESTSQTVSDEHKENEFRAEGVITSNTGKYKADIKAIPEFSNKAYVVINNNVPGFKSVSEKVKYFERYSPLDDLGRCGVAYACLGKETMPKGERGDIGQVKPSGWKTVKYDCVDGKYLYNRCHLIGFQLSGENANERNLITGTRYMNVEGMLPFENMVADYIDETNNHVLYRVTPVFNENELVARGVQIEAYSVEDNGEGICFNVFCYNNQPGVDIDYATGDSTLVNDKVEHSDNKQNTENKNTENKNTENKNTENKNTENKNTENNKQTTERKHSSEKTDESKTSEDNTNTSQKTKYILNTNSKKIHRSTCSAVRDMSEDNKKVYKGSKDALLDKGYTECDICNP